jgi:putative membrane protein
VSGFLLRSIFNGITLVCALVAMPGIFVDSLGTTLLGATFLGLANAFIRPALTMVWGSLDPSALGWTTLFTNVTLPVVAFSVLPGIEVRNLIAIVLLIAGLSASSYVLTRFIQDR